MNINPETRFFSQDNLAVEFIEFLEENQSKLNLNSSEIYYNYPLYRDIEGDLIKTHVLIISENHGVIIVGISRATDQNKNDIIDNDDENLGDVFNQIYSRLIKNKNLKRGKKELLFSVETLLYAPLLTSIDGLELDSHVSINGRQVEDFLENQKSNILHTELIENILSSIDGAAGIVRAKPRLDSIVPGSKGDVANKVEAAILTFDRKQKHGYILPLEGVERIRGLAGSGKTIVLAMKVALTHIEYPDATILFTFYTKSLYQYIRRLITRFYKQFSEFEPDFDKIKIMHAWGGHSIPGVYYEASMAHGSQVMSYQVAKRYNFAHPFDHVCEDFLKKNKEITPLYDYVFIDEGQDFPSSFIKLCSRISKNHKIVLAYDELQTIFQTTAPSFDSLFGDIKPKMSEDVVLYKCYRNPREIIVCAHALGFGIYGSNIVQMLENKEHWEDVGYRVHEGDFTEGSNIIIERPPENSLPIVSKAFKKEDIISVRHFSAFEEEIDFVSESIRVDIKGGLRPDDILVEVVDDRNAKNYLWEIQQRLEEFGINSHNIHADSFGLKDFHAEGCVTLSTVHKAKGNEAFMVYVVGVDSLFGNWCGVRERNMIFTAMTRAKGWVCLTGVGDLAENCAREVSEAMKNFPYLRFVYPSETELKIMKRDLKESGIKRQRIDRILDEILAEMSPAEIKKYLDQKFKTKTKK